MPAPKASALERLRGKLSQPLDPRDPLHALAPLIDHLHIASSAPATSATLAPSSLQSPQPLQTLQLPELLAGELPRGQLVEMVGARSSGRFSTVLAAIAAATMAGEAVALVDLGDGLDPQAAAALGVDLRRLLWLRPATLKQALAGAEILLGGGFPMVALDLGNPPVRGGRGTEAGWLRLARAARAHGAALLVASPYRVSGTAAAIVLRSALPAGGGARWQGSPSRATPRETPRKASRPSGGPPWLLDGLSCQVTLEKCRGRLLPARPQELELRLAPLELPAAELELPRPRSQSRKTAATAATALLPPRRPLPLQPLARSRSRETVAATAAAAALRNRHRRARRGRRG
jgi:hypothetical protein